MVKKYGDFKAAPSGGSREKLPAGGYVAKIMGVELKERSDGRGYLQIAFDISEGEHKDFFANDYRQNTNDDRKWRGNYYLNIPQDNGTEQDGWTKRSFGNAVWALEESNSGYHWDWDETKLKGKLFGVLFRNREWEYNGRTGWTTEACSIVDVSSIRNNTFRMPADKPLGNRASAAAAATFEELAGGDESDLPF